MGLIVAIDGPAGAGKSTVARAVAEKLEFTQVNTGAIYRALTLLAIERGITEAEPDRLTSLARSLPVRFAEELVFLEDREITQAIRSDFVTQQVSAISAVPGVRAELLDIQRGLGRAHPRGAVLEGRDIGTVVFPDAEVKVFLTASAAERARRRFTEMSQAGAPGQTLDIVLDAINRRDAYDGSRKTAPLKAADDATVIDTTEKSLIEVVSDIEGLVQDYWHLSHHT